MAIQAPILNSILQPAVYDNNSIILKIDYRLSRGTSASVAQNYGFNFLIKTIPLNTLIFAEIEIIEEKIGEYVILQLIGDKFTPGESYKIQVQFIGQEEGYWSIPATFKVIAEPRIQLYQDSTISSNIYTGMFQANILDNSESLQYSKFILKDQYGNIVEESPKIIHNSLNDGPTAVQQEGYSSILQTESYTFLSDLKNLQEYSVLWEITTNSGYTACSEPITFVQIEEIEPGNILRIEAVADNENGIINGYLYYWDRSIKGYTNPQATVFGDYIILRSSSKDNYKTWIEINRMTLNSLHLDSIGNKYSRQFFQDYSVESNISYRYALKQYSTTYSSKKIKSNAVNINYEHLYLFDEEKQLNLKYNTKITTYKNNILEAKQDTIGGKYPYIFRNGNVMYKEFAISSLISYQADPLNLFQLQEKQINERSYTSLLSHKNIISEKDYRDEVLAWLNNGKPKYLKSNTEGMFKIYTMNATLQPNDTLGRMLYTVSFTAYEIGEIDKTIVKFPNAIISHTNEFIISQPMDWKEDSQYYFHEHNYNTLDISVKNLIISEIKEISKVVVYKSDGSDNEFIVGPAGLKIDELEFQGIDIYPANTGEENQVLHSENLPWITYIIKEDYEFNENYNQEFFKINNLNLSSGVELVSFDLHRVIERFHINVINQNSFIGQNNEINVHNILNYIVRDIGEYPGSHQATYSTFIQLQFIPISTDWSRIEEDGNTIESKSYVKFKESMTDTEYQYLQVRHAITLEDIQLDELILGPNIQVNCAYRGVFYDIDEE